MNRDIETEGTHANLAALLDAAVPQPVDRQILLLSIVDDIPLADIAAALDMPISVVRKRRVRAIRRLRDHLAGIGFLGPESLDPDDSRRAAPQVTKANQSATAAATQIALAEVAALQHQLAATIDAADLPADVAASLEAHLNAQVDALVREAAELIERIHDLGHEATGHLAEDSLQAQKDRKAEPDYSKYGGDTPIVTDRDQGKAAAAAASVSFKNRLAVEIETVSQLSTEEASRLGARAANQLVASARWSQVVGDRLDTTQVARLLGVTRQALAKRQVTGSILGLRGDGTTWYPTWQFDVDEARIRPEVRDLIGAFRDRLDDVDPLTIAAWATTPQDEDLAGETPAQWLRAGRDSEQLRRAAERASARLAR